MKIIRVLCNDMLLLDDISDADYEYCHEPLVIGIATKDSENKRQYFVYNTNERGYIDWIEEKETFNEALLFARKMYRGMIKAYSNMSIDKKKSKEKAKNDFHEEITQEIFRNLLIKNNIADDYVLVFEDSFELKKDEYKGVSGTVNVFKNQSNVWNVWEINDDGERHNISNFANQIEAYIDAAKRRGLNLNTQDFMHNENDVLNIIESAKNYLKYAINFYEADGVTKLIQRYLLLEIFEKKIFNNSALNGNDLVKKKK